MSCDEVAFSCFVSTVGLVLPFVLVDMPLSAGMAGEVISNSASASVVWINQQGLRRVCVFSNEISAVFTYTLSSGDTRVAHQEQGYLQVSIGTAVFNTNKFIFRVIDHF